MQSMEETDVAAVSRAREGDSDAFRELVERHSRRVFRLAYRMTGSEQDAEDVVQETFLRAYSKLGGFEERANFGTWLYRIAMNCAVDLMRKRRRIDEVTTEEESALERIGVDAAGRGSGADRMIYGIEIQRKVREAMQLLSPMERAAFILRHFEGMSIHEISRALGLRSNATKHSIFRAVRKMREALEPLMGAIR